MKYRIHYHQEIDATDLEAGLRKAAKSTLQFEQVEAGSLTLVLTNQETIQRLNKEFAGLDQPTDVLAFPGSGDDPDEEGIYYGDIVIALPIARQQAAQAGHSALEECALLVIHGTLHLLGYDHGTKSEKDKMWARQKGIFQHLDLSLIEPEA
jgi:probable rRNA maturation factor